MNLVMVGVTASLFARLETVVGAFPILLPFRITQRVPALALGLGSFVAMMLALGLYHFSKIARDT